MHGSLAGGRVGADSWSGKAIAPDLASLWSSLGVKSDQADRITFDDQAPLASIRREMTHRMRAVAVRGGSS